MPAYQTENMSGRKDSFKESLREGGAILHALAEKNHEKTDTVIPKEVTYQEKTKDSLTGKAFLPKPTASPPKAQTPTSAETPETTNNTSTPSANPFFISGESEGTPQADTARENPVETADAW